MRGARIKITNVRIVQLKISKDLGSYPDWLGNPRAIKIGGGEIIEIQSDQGIAGIGPGVDVALLPQIKNLLVGADPFDVDLHAERPTICAAEAAVWDIAAAQARRSPFGI